MELQSTSYLENVDNLLSGYANFLYSYCFPILKTMNTLHHLSFISNSNFSCHQLFLYCSFLFSFAYFFVPKVLISFRSYQMTIFAYSFRVFYLAVHRNHFVDPYIFIFSSILYLSLNISWPMGFHYYELH